MLIDTITQTKAALKVFFTAVNEWKLSKTQALALLGTLSNNAYDEYKLGIINSVSDDLLSRLAYITTIYGYHRLLFSEENIILWLKNDSKLDSRWHGYSPLNLMIKDIKGIILVYNYLSSFLNKS